MQGWVFKLIGASAVILVIAAGAHYFMGDSSGDQTSASVKRAPVEVVRAETARVAIRANALGTLEADQSIMLAPEIAGVVETIRFASGAQVKQGDVLLTLRSGNERAELQKAEADVALTAMNYERSKKLRERGSGSQQADDIALNAHRLSQAALALARANMDKTIIKAPFSGTIGLSEVSLGQYMQAGSPIASLVDTYNVRIDFRISEIYLSDIRVGQTVKVLFDALPAQEFQGTISAIDPVVDESGRAIRVRAVIENPDGVLRPGLFGRVSIVTGERAQAVVVPEGAIVPLASGASSLYVVSDKGIAMRRTVVPGERMSGRVEIREGVKAGEQVVVAGQLRLHEGAPVKVVNAAPASGEGG